MTPEQHTADTAAQAVLGNFQLSAALPQGKSINVQGYLMAGESVESLNQRLDLLHDVMDRQRTRAEIPELEVKLEQSMKRLDEIRGHYTALNDKKANGKTLTSAEKSAISVQDVNINHIMEDIEKGRVAIADAKAKVGMA